jgi:hypothetical protein
MKLVFRFLSLLLVGMTALASVATAADSIGYFAAIAADAFPIVGQQYYTRHCFMYEKNVSLTTNYWRGTLVSINTQVTLVSMNDKKMVLRLPSGEKVKIENVEKYSKRSMQTISRDILTTRPVPLDSFSEPIAAAIKMGEMQLGMTKEQVVMARGYPPGHKTPSLDNDHWIYWNSRGGTETIVFKDGLLVDGRGLQPEPPHTVDHTVRQAAQKSTVGQG